MCSVNNANRKTNKPKSAKRPWTMADELGINRKSVTVQN